MALTRTKLKEILSKAEADEEKIGEAVDKIIAGHSATTDALKEQLEAYKADAEKLPTVQKELDELKAKADGENPFEHKYKNVKKEFDDFKKAVDTEKLNRQKKTAVKKLLKEINVGEKWINRIVDKFVDYDKLELDGDKLKNADELKEQYKTEYSDCIVTTRVQGAKTETPPGNTGGSKMTKEEILAVEDTAKRQKLMAENKELFL